MLLTITTTRRPATDLGWLLHKHPAKVQAFELAFGRAHVFYPEAGEDRWRKTPNAWRSGMGIAVRSPALPQEPAFPGRFRGIRALFGHT